MKKYPKPELFTPTIEEAERVAELLNKCLTVKRVVSVNGIGIKPNNRSDLKK